MKLKESLKNWYLHFTQLKWTVGVADYDPEAILDPKIKLKIHWVKHNSRESWFADPFILSVTENFVFILVEEFIYARNKGRISRLKIDRKSWKLLQVDPVIDIATHLSFPVYYREEDKVYIYPESTKTGRLALYEYDEAIGTAEFFRDLSLAPLADAVIWKMNDKRVLAATTSPNDNGKVLDIYSYHENAPIEKDVPIDSFSFSENIARNAGIPFEIQGRLFRPAQNCSRHYGECVIIQEIINKEGRFQFKEINRFYSPLYSHRVAFHTFNVFENQYVAVDAEGMRYGIIPQLLFFIRERFRR